ncbi:uncharacterized protein NECHADRAFT_100260 [Fusarium vanettenii 77-13-4]|uniref:Fungal N-terminal domain-containing protein n=1 Tax=Fusarium vanettenii (strain ATCC MYA-4622 / CBS 123669 / FGSC 9596 / NRRL 45880 / 77-13-4) TaxID=660122 RepID=C7Z7M8_FUSV7|nr:uncharacterized protein NECHADRAFT_100260 [Fusarium vanettenii 77-13-4]EEU39718.1 predicted protein [Fusarium vanettenii 77-13-4]
MEPLEIVGATAAIAQLLKLAVDIGDQARQLVQSFVHAPKELAELSAKIDRLGLLLHHANELDKDLANADAGDLIPDAHNSLLYSCLGVSLAALEKVRTLHGDGGQSSATHRLRWAAIDKRKAQKVLKDVKESEAALDTVLSILSVRLASFNRASISAVQLGQVAIRDDITSAVQELGSCFQAQSGLLGTKLVERLRQDQQRNSLMFTQTMTKLLNSQERAEARITETQTQMTLELSSLKTTYRSGQPQTSPSRGPRDVATEPLCFESSASAISSDDDIIAQVKERTEEWRWKEPLARQDWSFKTKAKSQDAYDSRERVKGSLSLISKKNLWKARALIKTRVNILGQRIICLEIRAQHFTQTWLSMPSLSGIISVVNVRPNDAPIFKACHGLDLPTVKHLLETGEASIHDVDQKGDGLLEVKILRSVGFSDWNPGGCPNEFLKEAIRAGDIAELLFGLEEVKLDPNNYKIPLLSHSKVNVFMASLLVEFDAQVNPAPITRPHDTPLNASIRKGNIEVMHWLLSRDANTILDGYESSSAWQTVWCSVTRLGTKGKLDALNFLKLEGVLSHLLWHSSDPHATFKSVISRHGRQYFYFISSTTRAQEVARAVSYDLRVPELEDYGWGLEPERESLRLCQEAYERSEQLRVPDFLASWSDTGILYGESYDSDDGSEYSWRQLARFPLVRLLVNALQLAGYQAEMSDDGDVYYDDDDGDRYFDAREYQPEEGVDDGLVANCPICQDPEKYGLSHIFAEAERAREVLREYRRRKAEEMRQRRW